MPDDVRTTVENRKARSPAVLALEDVILMAVSDALDEGGLSAGEALGVVTSVLGILTAAATPPRSKRRRGTLALIGRTLPLACDVADAENASGDHA